MSVKSSLRISKKRDPENGRITDNELLHLAKEKIKTHQLSDCL